MTTSCQDRSESGYLRDRRPAPRPRDKHSVMVSHGLERDCLNALRNKARLAVVIGKLWELKSISMELFDSVSVEFEVDPEAEDSHFLIFNVTATGHIKEIASRRQEWHRRTHSFLGNKCGLVKLIIDVT